MNFIFLRDNTQMPRDLVNEISSFCMPSERTVRRNYGRMIDELKYEIEMNKEEYFQYVGWRFF